jgi:hypothetical protein
VHPSVARIGSFLFLLLGGIIGCRGGGGIGWDVEADAESCAGGGSGFEEGAAIKRECCHGTPQKDVWKIN